MLIGLIACTVLISASGCTSKPASNNQDTNTTTDNSAPKQINYLQYTNTSFDKSMSSAKITLGEYKNIDIEVDMITLKEEDIITQIETDFSKREEIKEGIVEKGDSLNIDFVGKIDGKEFEGGSAKGQPITIGSGGYIPGFEEGLIGVEIGSTKDVTVTFPNDYGVETLNGKEAVFTITVNYKLGDNYLPEITDELINTETEGKYKTYDEYYKYVKESKQKDYDLRNNNLKRDALTMKLHETSKVEGLDKSEIDTYVNSAIDYYKNAVVNNGTTYEEYLKSLSLDEDGFKKMIEEEYTTMMTNTIILSKIAEAEKIEVTNAEIEVATKNIYSQYGYPDAEQFANDLIKQNMMGDFINGVRETKIVDFLLQNNTFKDKTN